MALFLSTFINRIDKKGRVSVPASFRASVSAQAFNGVVLFRSHAHACLEGVDYATMEELSGRLDAYDFLSSDQDDLATSIFGEAVQLTFDGDGRIVLPADLIAHAGLGDQVAFVGMGRKFQIWNPDHYKARRDEARQHVFEKGLTVPRRPDGDKGGRD
ncbi:MAG: division/cell wall cluster transcriptional repressor MraZ [Alphaproteobacteria bacterium]|jgi:MraZ protein|nr:division/cell wall cluster transcriptional repressor MraZ [Alphaproteobacteria bacterium]MDP7223187.1 division/cell wall cluster transcriptional repressor MraZ [Alphaproteobacteria bacterium]